MGFVLLLATLVGLFFAWKLWATRNPPSQRRGKRGNGRHRSARRTASAAEKPWEAVSIRPCDDACLDAWELEGKRFLLREAPHLPLPSCDSGNCQCEFARHDDRRSPGDRRSGLTTLDQEFARQGLPDRSRGRRKTD